MYDIKVLKEGKSVVNLTKKFANISKACEKMPCVLGAPGMGLRLDTFYHSIDKETGDL